MVFVVFSSPRRWVRAASSGKGSPGPAVEENNADGMLRAATSDGAPAACLKPFKEYRELETQSLIDSELSAVSADGALLEYETLELRVHPPNVEVDNDACHSESLVTVDSANRPGTLVEVVQCFTELGLQVRRARISSDRGWFVDDFYVTGADGRKVTDERKLAAVRKVLRVELPEKASAQFASAAAGRDATVLEFAGEDRPGLLADIASVLEQNGFDFQTAAVWTHNGRAACVLNVCQEDGAVLDVVKLQALRQLLLNMLGGPNKGVFAVHKVNGAIHHDRRLHLLLLEEEKKQWVDCQGETQTQPSQQPSSRLTDEATTVHGYCSPKHSNPEVVIKPMARLGYWVVTVKCKDRDKLLFDTACTLADMDYDVYHGTVDTMGNVARQEFFVRPRFRGIEFDKTRVEMLRYFLEASIQRRFPKGLKVHVQPLDKRRCLIELLRELKHSGLSISRAKVRSSAGIKAPWHTFHVIGADGCPPDRLLIENICHSLGGKLVVAGVTDNIADDEYSKAQLHRFRFTLLDRRSCHEPEGSSSSGASGSQ